MNAMHAFLQNLPDDIRLSETASSLQRWIHEYEALSTISQRNENARNAARLFVERGGGVYAVYESKESHAARQREALMLNHLYAKMEAFHLRLTTCRFGVRCQSLDANGRSICNSYHSASEIDTIHATENIKRCLADSRFYFDRYVSLGCSIANSTPLPDVVCNIVRRYCAEDLITSRVRDIAALFNTVIPFPIFHCQCECCVDGITKGLRVYPIRTDFRTRDYQMRQCIFCGTTEQHNRNMYIAVQQHPYVPFKSRFSHGFHSLSGAVIHQRCARECGMLRAGLLSMDARALQSTPNFSLLAASGFMNNNCKTRPPVFDDHLSRYCFDAGNITPRILQTLQFCTCKNLKRCACGVLVK